jgi:hypothetical protein
LTINYIVVAVNCSSPPSRISEAIFPSPHKTLGASSIVPLPLPISPSHITLLSVRPPNLVFPEFLLIEFEFGFHGISANSPPGDHPSPDIMDQAKLARMQASVRIGMFFTLGRLGQAGDASWTPYQASILRLRRSLGGLGLHLQCFQSIPAMAGLIVWVLIANVTLLYRVCILDLLNSTPNTSTPTQLDGMGWNWRRK